MKKYPLRSLAWYALPLLVCIVAMGYFSPPGEKARYPYTSVVIAMEFAVSANEVNATLDPLEEAEISDLDTLNYIDFFFMLAYATFFGFFILRYSKAISNPSLAKFSWVAVFIFFADLGENIAMLRISALYLDGSGDFRPYINFLPFFTWGKWCGLTAAFTYLGIFLARGRLFSQAISLLFFLPSILLMITLVGHDHWINRFTTSIFLAFTAMLIFAAGFNRTSHTSV